MGVSFVKAGRLALLGRKIGMTQVYDSDENVVPVTVLEVGPCTILQVKSEDSDGYTSLQVGFTETSKRVPRPQQGLFQKAGVTPFKVIREVPAVDVDKINRVPLRSEVGGTVELVGAVAGENLVEMSIPRTKRVIRSVVGAAAAESPEGEAAEEGSDEGEASASLPKIQVKDSGGAVQKEYEIPAGSSIEVSSGQTVSDGDILAFVPPGEEGIEEIQPGMQLTVDQFSGVAKVDVSGITKGRGFQGTIKRHNFNAGDKSHGSKNVRMVGTTGMGTDPGRVWKGSPMPGHMGQSRRKVRGLEVIQVDAARNLLLVKGSVPGADGDVVIVQESFIR